MMCRPISLMGVKRTWRWLVTMSANDPKRTFQTPTLRLQLESRDAGLTLDKKGNGNAGAVVAETKFRAALAFRPRGQLYPSGTAPRLR
jgi:hypothetical protein